MNILLTGASGLLGAALSESLHAQGHNIIPLPRNTAKPGAPAWRPEQGDIDLTNVPPDVYAEVCRSLRVPVIGGQAPKEADGKIQVAVSGVGYFAATIDREDGRPNTSKYIYDTMKGLLDSIHAGDWSTGQ